MSKLTLAVLAGATLTLATPAFAARGGGANMGNVVMSGSGQITVKAGSCRHQRCESGAACVRRKSCKTRKSWFAEGLDALIR
jgi:hypothetical protein